VNGIITFSIKQRVPIVLFLFCVLGAGFVSFLNLNFAIPIEVAMEGIPNVKAIQSVSLSGGIQAQLSPNSPVGESYRYRLVGPPGHSVPDLKTLQDRVLSRRFKAVGGILLAPVLILLVLISLFSNHDRVLAAREAADRAAGETEDHGRRAGGVMDMYFRFRAALCGGTYGDFARLRCLARARAAGARLIHPSTPRIVPAG
jgi:hypothetical protein